MLVYYDKQSKTEVCVMGIAPDDELDNLITIG